MSLDLREVIKSYPDFPRPGILFRDVTTILKEPAYFEHAISQLEEQLASLDYDVLIAPESRGFIFATPIAVRQKKSLVLARKTGKLPGETISNRYFLEYGMDSIEIQKDDIRAGQRVVILDDLLATGGTCFSICEIVEQLGAVVVGSVFLIELEDLDGRKVLEEKCEVKAVLGY